MIEIIDKTKCNGCSACAAGCPANAIKMENDTEGFLYPSIDSVICTGCGLCIKICPVKTPKKQEKFIQHTYICQNKDERVRLDSTSGGVFSAVAGYILNRDGIIYGAAFDDDFVVKHIKIQSEEELEKLRGSKYVQSVIEPCYKEIEKFLEQERWVLFTGTPCQIEGIKSYLKKEYKTLLLMDIACYSVSSPMAWEKFKLYLQKIEKIDISKVKKIKFRDKTHFGYEYTLMALYDISGNELWASGPESNKMLRGFVSNSITRPSCYNCAFKKQYRVSDFTVWDCYNVYQYSNEMDDNKGTSHILIQSEKGMEVFQEISMQLNLIEVDTEKAVSTEPAIKYSAEPSNNRDKFMLALANDNNGESYDLFFPDTIKVMLNRNIRVLLSKTGLYSKVKRFVIKSRKG